LALAAAGVLAFFVPFAWLRLGRGAPLGARTQAIIAVAATLLLGVVAFGARLDPDRASLLFPFGLALLGLAAAPRGGWRFVAPAAGALGLVILAGMALGPLLPDIFPPSPKFRPLPPLGPRSWALFVAGSLALLVPWRWASAAAAAAWWLALATSEPHRSFYMGVPALMATAALLSAAVPARRYHP
jgi:hypothetical protein